MVDSLPPLFYTSEPGSWARRTFETRIPRIIDDVIAANDFSHEIVAALGELRNEIVAGKLCLLIENTDDHDAWNESAREHAGKSWLDVPWYWAETFFYRRVLEATRYFQPGKFFQHDPYAKIKRAELEPHRAPHAVNAALQHLPSDVYTAFDVLLHADLWGNRVDLSMYNIARETASREDEQSNTLVDDTAQVWAHLEAQPGKRIDFICDNAGTELLFDLALADFLLRTNLAREIHLHLKPQPFFVSDAMIKDVIESFDAFRASNVDGLRQLASRLLHAIDHQRLTLNDDAFWVSGLFFHAMPSRLHAALANASLIIIKGDANYRRLIGDCHWNPTTSFESAAEYFLHSLVAIRTVKSEIIVGLRDGQADELSARDPDWQINGSRGVIQFKR